jgi:hypothetical protein
MSRLTTGETETGTGTVGLTGTTGIDVIEIETENRILTVTVGCEIQKGTVNVNNGIVTANEDESEEMTGETAKEMFRLRTTTENADLVVIGNTTGGVNQTLVGITLDERAPLRVVMVSAFTAG